jgi:hypothetical protein
MQARGRGELARRTGSDAWDREDDKLSHRIFAIAEGWAEVIGEDPKAVSAHLAVLCWNLAVLGVGGADPELDQYLARAVDIGERDAHRISLLCREMVARKHWLYPRDLRFVIDYQASSNARGTELWVVSSWLSETAHEARQNALESLLGKPKPDESDARRASSAQIG